MSIIKITSNTDKSKILGYKTTNLLYRISLDELINDLNELKSLGYKTISAENEIGYYNDIDNIFLEVFETDKS